jgi:hypothetical protein
MRQWGISKEAAQALYNKNMMKKKQKEKEREKHMSAAEKY